MRSPYLALGGSNRTRASALLRSCGYIAAKSCGSDKSDDHEMAGGEYSWNSVFLRERAAASVQPRCSAVSCRLAVGCVSHVVPAAMARAATHLDCNWNMGKTSITANALPWLKYFRQNGHAKTPIVLAEDTPPAGGK